jgi:Uma2 family endonuclease
MQSYSNTIAYNLRNDQTGDPPMSGHLHLQTDSDAYGYQSDARQTHSQIINTNPYDSSPEIDYDRLVTEDDTPVDNFYCEKQLRLLPESLSNSWDRKEPYIVAADVGIYDYKPVTPIVPDVFLSLDVQYADDIWLKKNRCYMMSIFKKPPELVIEIVSNKVGGEDTDKLSKYASMGIKYYVIFDPLAHILPSTFCVYTLIDSSYKKIQSKNRNVWFNDLDIGLKVQIGVYEKMEAEWLRWCDKNGNILHSGQESASIERKQKESEKKRAEAEKNRAEAAIKNVEIEKSRAEAEKNRAEAAIKKSEDMAKEIARLKAELQNKI